MLNCFNFIVNDMDPIKCTLILYLVNVLRWLDDGCFTVEICSPDVIDISSMR